jgi:hypothetical protein
VVQRVRLTPERFGKLPPGTTVTLSAPLKTNGACKLPGAVCFSRDLIDHAVSHSIHAQRQN